MNGTGIHTGHQDQGQEEQSRPNCKPTKPSRSRYQLVIQGRNPAISIREPQMFRSKGRSHINMHDFSAHTRASMIISPARTARAVLTLQPQNLLHVDRKQAKILKKMMGKAQRIRTGPLQIHKPSLKTESLPTQETETHSCAGRPGAGSPSPAPCPPPLCRCTRTPANRR